MHVSVVVRLAASIDAEENKGIIGDASTSGAGVSAEDEDEDDDDEEMLLVSYQSRCYCVGDSVLYHI